MAKSKQESNAVPEATLILPASGLASDVLQLVDGSDDQGLRFAEGSVSESRPVANGTRDYSGPNAVFDVADDMSRSEVVADTGSAELESWIVFELGGERFGVPIQYVVEVVRVDRIARVPDAPPAIRGVTNLRGRVVPVIDLRVRLWLDRVETTEESRLVVVSVRGRTIAMLVDGRCELHRLDRRSVSPPPEDVLTTASTYVFGVLQAGDSLIILLSVEAVLLLNSEKRA